MEREREEDQDKYGWTHSRSIDSSGATISNIRRDARARAGWRGAATLSPGVGCDSTEQGDKVIIYG